MNGSLQMHDPPQTLTSSANSRSSTVEGTQQQSSVDETFHIAIDDTRPGYPGFAACLAAVEDSSVFRRFRALSVRNILYQQDRLCELEEKLAAQDRLPGYRDTRRFDQDSVRQELMKEIQQTILDYEAALRAHQHFLSYEQPTPRQIRNLRKYVYDYNPLVKEEITFLYEPVEELMTFTKNSERTPLLAGIASAAMLHRFFVKKQIKDTHSQGFTIGSGWHTYSSTAVNRTYRGFMLLGCWLFIIMPVVVLFFMRAQEHKLIVVTICMGVFSTLLTVFTNAKDWEILAATAAYGALLLVFFQVRPND